MAKAIYISGYTALGAITRSNFIFTPDEDDKDKYSVTIQVDNEGLAKIEKLVKEAWSKTQEQDSIRVKGSYRNKQLVDGKPFKSANIRQTSKLVLDEDGDALLDDDGDKQYENIEGSWNITAKTNSTNYKGKPTDVKVVNHVGKPFTIDIVDDNGDVISSVPLKDSEMGISRDSIGRMKISINVYVHEEKGKFTPNIMVYLKALQITKFIPYLKNDDVEAIEGEEFKILEDDEIPF